MNKPTLMAAELLKRNGKNRAVIMDRDGTLLKDTHYLNDPDHVQIYKGVIPALKRLKKRGWKLIIGTNQSGIARGYLSTNMLEKIHKRILAICRKQKVHIDAIFFCPHHPNQHCSCRKPKTGMLKKAERKHRLDLKKCVVIGDKKSDIDWGINAGTKTILVLTGCGKQYRADRKTRADYVSRSLTHAVQWILNHE